MKPLSLTHLCSLLLIMMSSTAYAEEATPDVKTVIQDGTDWLISQQQENGAFSNPKFPGLTGIALMAIHASDHPEKEKVLKKGYDFLLSNAREDGAIYSADKRSKGDGMPNYNTAICMQALHQAGNPEFTPVILKAREFIASTQYQGDEEKYAGAWGYGQQGDKPRTDLLNTYYSLEAMHVTADLEEFREGKKVTINKSLAAEHLATLQNPEEAGEEAGGFNYKTTGETGFIRKILGRGPSFRSYGSLTYAGTLALIYSDVDRSDERVQSALRWCRDHWTLDENPGMGENGLYFFYNVMARCLNAAGVDEIELKNESTLNWKDSLRTKLLNLKRSDEEGGTYWVNDTGRWWENDPILVTSYAVRSLAATQD